ncbi:MAG: enoyl-CoA hydratase-related protein [bacterium]
MSSVLQTEIYRDRLSVTLNRPDVHNALDAELIDAVGQVLRQAAGLEKIRYVVLEGAGPSFCAGADLNWMRGGINASFEENRAGAGQLAAVLDAIVACPKPVIASVHGSALGGGLGFVAACDLAVATPDAVFGLTEVRLGLVPAMVFPYLLRKVARHHLLQAALTGERFGAERAQHLGLINEIDENREATIATWAQSLEAAGPEAVARVKELFHKVPQLSWEAARAYTIDLIARVRAGREAQEGMRAFLDKQRPPWQR